MCYFFPISLLVLFLFSNSVFLSCFWYGLLIDLAVASLNQSMVSAKTMKVKKMHEQLGSQFIVFFVCLFVLVGLGYFFCSFWKFLTSGLNGFLLLFLLLMFFCGVCALHIVSIVDNCMRSCYFKWDVSGLSNFLLEILSFR